MSSVPDFSGSARTTGGAEILRSQWLAWVPIGVGLLALYVPTFSDVSETFWSQERGSSGPVILIISGWLIWRQRSALIGGSNGVAGSASNSAPNSAPNCAPEVAFSPMADQPATRLGALLLLVGLVSYALGRSQQFFQFEVVSLVPVLAGSVLLMRGPRALRQMWFPLLFLLLLVPLPGSLLDALLIPLKQQVSAVVASLLYNAGFPVARTGVVLTIGQYQLLIADACSGLNSMVALSGIGLLYVHVAGHPGVLRNAILLATILPIAFLSNVIRVMVLMLGTYWFGDGVGHQLHDQMQYVQMVLAFGMFFLVDWILLKVLPGRRRSTKGATA